jgi:hypothetical protein
LRGLSLLLPAFLLLSICTAHAIDDWDRGENILSNSDFETGNVGEEPDQWQLGHGG